MYRTLTYKTERDEDNLAGADDGFHEDLRICSFIMQPMILAYNQQL